VRGSIIWRCEKCGNKAKGRCDHPQGGYSVVIWVGKRQKWKKVGRVKKDAERYLAEVLSQIHTGKYKEIKQTLFREFSQRWLDDYAQSSVKPLTLRSYKWLVRTYLNPTFGHLPLTKITVRDIQGFIAGLVKERKISPRSINYNLCILKMMFKCARQWGLLHDSPAEHVKRVRQEHREMDYLRPHEIRLLLDSSEGQYKTLFMLAVMTGLRMGEILGLQWGDIDWKSSSIRVQRSLYWRNMEEFNALKGKKKRMWTFSSPKSKRSIRNVVMSPKLKEALEIHRISCPVSPHDLVFSDSRGEPLHSNLVVSRHYRPSLTRAGLRHIRFHDLRHSYTTLLIAQGANVKFIQAQLGHASIKTTMDKYGHLLPDNNADLGLKLDRCISSSELQLQSM